MKIYPLLTIFLAISLFGLLFFQLFFNSDVEEFNQKSLAPFESKLLNGDSFTSEQLKNDSLSLINVWATWCVGCRLEHSYLMELEKKGISIIGINYKDDKGKAFKWLDQFGDPYVKNIFDEFRQCISIPLITFEGEFSPPIASTAIFTGLIII